MTTNSFNLFFIVTFLCYATSNILLAAESTDELEQLNVSDGPYVFHQNETLNLQWLCDSQVFKRTISSVHTSLPYNFNECELHAKLSRLTFLPDLVEYQGNFKVAALSDLHGQYELMIRLLTKNEIIDDKGNWNFGNGHFVITGDIFDRGDKVTEILWFIYHLELQAKKAGGKLHLLLGNHEVMVLNGDLRYLHPKYVEAAKLLDKPFEQLFAKSTILGDWLRSKSVLVKINDMLFAHGGFHPSLVQDKRTLVEINQVFKHNLVKSELSQPRTGFGEYLHKTNGPIWYRGYFKDSGATSEEINFLLNHFKVAHIVVGHTSQKQVETRYQGRVIAIDSSIKRGNYGEILFVDGDKKWRGSLIGEKLPLN